jgi:hypothetical protein
MHYFTIVQDADEVRELDNAPALSIPPYLITSHQEKLLTVLSVYAERGDTRAEVRRLYMNEVALSVWKAMGKKVEYTSSRHRPPTSAVLVVGVPFSD